MPPAVRMPPDEPPDDQGNKPAGWWRASGDAGRVLCQLCPRACSVKPGDRGFCFVRQNVGGRMVSTTYGRSTGFCVDPIEKKPLNQFYPGTAVLSFGTAGCNLGCKFCQNWSMSRSRDVDAACDVADPETIAAAAVQLGCHSVAYTYNDPIVFAEYAIDTARACRRAGVKNVAVTSGYITPEARTAFYADMDAANVDLKGFSEEFYRNWTGGHLEPVLDTLRWIARETNVWLEITNLIVPQLNDSPEQIEAMCRWIVDELGPDVPLHFSAFHPDFKVTDRPATSPQTLIAAHDIARRAGLRYVYTGNVRDPEHQGTRCPGCEQIVIQRSGYVLGVYGIRNGRCRHCDTPIAGRFDDTPGNWGGRRQPVRIADYARAKPPSNAATPSSKEQNVESKPALTDQQETQIFRAAGRRVAAAVKSEQPEAIEGALAEIAQTPLYGAFVSLKRGGQLRSCCGYLGGSIPMAKALDHAAVRAAKEDPRFPPISTSELSQLDMEVWLLWAPEPIEARGDDRIEAVTIGKHGLQIARGAARGLLLPGVAVDHHLDAKGFLEQVCKKAGLPLDAWRDDATSLSTFEGYAIRGKLDTEIDAPEDAPALPGGPTGDDVAALAEFCRGNVLAMLSGATPNHYLPGRFDGGVNGLAFSVGAVGSEQCVECSKLSVRPQMPMQATLSSLAQATAGTLRARGVDANAAQAAPVALTVLLDPAMHGTADGPKLEGIDPRHRAVLVIDPARSAWVFDPAKTAAELFDEALSQGGFRDPGRANVVSFAVVSTEPRKTVAHVPQPQGGPDVRPAAVAGSFYPGTAEEVERALDDLFPADKPQPEPWPAVMVPHAGWVYSGKLAAEVFSRVTIPEQVIVFCPKHRPGGAEWAVAPHRIWSLPGRDVASDPDLARRLADTVDGLELDAVAHRQEHAIEVLLPILARVAPEARVVGITIGDGELDALLHFGEQLAAVLREMSPRPLLVISSDMHHFAADAENRRLDRLALDAMETHDPAQLLETIRSQRISMCGVRPAVIAMEALRHLEGLDRHKQIGYTTSAEASGDTSRVVGYAGVLLG
ncbi:MAG: AmmeMemoRadiSam system radical SAM enzyme [Candidatus Nealsonbacteria bacterium]|nr:AmmeMemoRadiSam system radical SAM enzyme [Candidatus Nealsonbacteria bacterium]